MSLGFWIGLIGATFAIATPLMWASLGNLLNEKSGVMNLGIEGTMYVGAFGGLAIASESGSIWLGLIGAIIFGCLAGLLVAVFTVTMGVNQHVVGIGTTLLLVSACEFVNRLRYGSGSLAKIEKFGDIIDDAGPLSQNWMTYFVFLILAPLMWWTLRSTGFGLRLTAVGEHPEAADVAGINVNRTRYVALVVGGALMALGGAYITLAELGTFTLGIISGRGWVAVALVIFGRWKVWPTVAGAVLFAATDALQLRLAITSTFGAVPNELLIALPYLVVVGALAIWGRKLRYPGAYLKPYRRA